jgi:inosose dehydratase
VPTADPSTLRLGTAPDSWGVWHAVDPLQVAWSTYLDEAAAAGYRWTELGPYGYLPTDPAVLRDELAARGLRLSGGTVTAALHRGPAALEAAKRACAAEAGTIAPLGARFVVLLPDGADYADHPTLTDEEWRHLTDGLTELARTIRAEHGLELVAHSHADTQIGTQAEIERLLAATDPELVRLCLDTGHAAYNGADSLALIQDHPDRIGYVHLKQVDPTILGRVRAERLDFPAAVRLGAMVEPPSGEPAMAPIIAALADLGRELFCIVEQDLYPCAPDVPLPIATRTRAYFEGLGLRIAD